MKFIVDFHIHSPYSRATSKALTPDNLEYWAALKGINVIGTGDCIHPKWLEIIKTQLMPSDNGLYELKPEFKSKTPYPKAISKDKTFFTLTTEISCIYKKHGRVRKIHNLCVLPDIEAATKLQKRLGAIGNIVSDGRPILGLDSKNLLEILLEISPEAYLIPAHIWTPWFSILGSKSGFDSIEACFEDLTPHIFALETGLSSDPPTNRRCSRLDRFRLVSNSDAHSAEKIGREANIFDTTLGYKGILDALKNDQGFSGTIEFFPNEGKYHYDGHRLCQISWSPEETIKHQGICPVCGKPVTIGVLNRVTELADRTTEEPTTHKQTHRSITSLTDLIAEITGTSGISKKTKAEYFRLLEVLGNETHILLNAELKEIEQKAGARYAEAIDRLRSGSVFIKNGYDGEFGHITVFELTETKRTNNNPQ